MKLCKCNKCCVVFQDMNPQIGAKEYSDDLVVEPLKQFTDLSDNDTSHDVQYFWGCPNCLTDEYLSDDVTTPDILKLIQ